MSWRNKADDPAEPREPDLEDAVFDPDPAEVELEPLPAEPLPALAKIRIKRTGAVMTVSGLHAEILVGARKAEYIDD